MRLRRIEFIAIALTAAFICFMGGYFAGSRGAVNIIAVAPEYGETQEFRAGGPANPGSGAALPDSGEAESTGSAVLGEVVSAADPAPPGGSGQAGGNESVGAPRGGDGKININTAKQSELTDLPGIGNVLAGRIVDYREKNGGFSKIEDIRNVSGIGDKRFEAIKDNITVG